MANQYEYTPLYYGSPCQVRYYDADRAKFVGGIAYQDCIICGYDGSVTPIQIIIDNAAVHKVYWDDAIIELGWLDISRAIVGN